MKISEDQIIKDANKSLTVEFDDIMHELMTFYLINEGEHCHTDSAEHLFIMRGISGILKRLINGELELRKTQSQNKSPKDFDSFLGNLPPPQKDN